MRLVVLGATSRTGLCLLGEAGRRGHQVVAFTRRPGALPDSPALAAVVHGDGRDPGLLGPALAGADAVVSLARHRRDHHQPGAAAPAAGALAGRRRRCRARPGRKASSGQDRR